MCVFFFHDTATTEIYTYLHTLSLHDALPISRHRIHGVLTREHAQYVFVDTPGFQTRHGGAMNRMMNRVVTQALAQVDVVAHVVEAGKWSPGEIGRASCRESVCQYV